MIFFKRERRLSELIRAADPLETVSTQASPHYGRLVFPLIALALTGIWWVASPKPGIVRKKSHVAIRKSDIAFIKSDVEQKTPDIVGEKSHVAIKKPHVAQRKSGIARQKSRIVVRKLRVAKEKRHTLPEKPKISLPENRDSGELIVVAVRPITPDELRQELESP
jgi:hypothetical protein